MGNYAPLFSIEAEHGFFPDGLCHELHCVPTTKTDMIICNAGLLVRNMMNGVRVFYDRNYIDSLRAHIADAEEPLNLVFKLFSRDRLFMNYTEPPTYGEDAIFYVSNLNGEGDENARLRLHQEEYIGNADFESLDSPLFEDVLSPTDRLVRPLLVVNIRLSGDETSLLGEESAVTLNTYYVRFRARETVWKYYLVGEMAKEALYITDLDNGTEFEMGETVKLGNNKPALTFRSKTHIPLRERADNRFQLRERNSGAGKVLIRRLPVASASQIGRELIEGVETPVSEIYINC